MLEECFKKVISRLKKGDFNIMSIMSKWYEHIKVLAIRLNLKQFQIKAQDTDLDKNNHAKCDIFEKFNLN